MKTPDTRSPELARQIAWLRSHGSTGAIAGLARFGIEAEDAVGVSMPALRKRARDIGRDHRLALGLWASRIHEAKILAGLVAEPEKLTAAQAERFVRDFSSWDVCDQTCLNLFRFSPAASARVLAWSRSRREFVKRAGFVMMAVEAVHGDLSPVRVRRYFRRIVEESTDARPMVRKAVNWALRQIGKRNTLLLKQARTIAGELKRSDDPSARWIGADAWRELSGSTARTMAGRRGRMHRTRERSAHGRRNA